jgi:hypothetical protein
MHTLLAASLLLSAASALAHDSRPAYLELVATDAAVFELSYATRAVIPVEEFDNCVCWWLKVSPARIDSL